MEKFSRYFVVEMRLIYVALFIFIIPFVWSDTPTLLPFQPFCAEQDAKDIHHAVDGLMYTDEGELINILTHRTYDQRMQIEKEYHRIYNKDMIEEIKSDVKMDGKFGKVIEGLLYTYGGFLAYKLQDAFAGEGTDEEVLIDAICPLNNTEKNKLINKYEEIYKVKLYDDVNGDTSHSFQNAILHVCLVNRNENPTLDQNIVESAVKELIESKDDGFKNTLKKYLQQLTLLELRAIFDKNEDIVKKIEKAYDGDTKKAYTTAVRAIRNRTKYFAERIHECVHGRGTHDDSLQIIVISRCEIDLQDIKDEYRRIFHKSMRKRVAHDLSGDYKDAILQLIGSEFLS